MSVKEILRIGLLCGALSCALAADTGSGSSDQQAPGLRKSTLESVSTADDLVALVRVEQDVPPVEAGSEEPAVAGFLARLLPTTHYSRQPFDDALSSRFLDRYISNLDNLRLHFLQSDLENFERYRDRLDDLTARGNTEPARAIFDRFLLRVEQRVTYVAKLLQSENFTFDGEDRYNLDRREGPWPRDAEEARVLWRQHLRFEILQEILGNMKDESEEESEEDPAAEVEVGSNGLTAEIEKKITRRYARLLKTLKDFDGADVFQYYLGALTHVYDPHSDYLGQATLENFAINMSLSLFGIGAVLQSEDGYCKVRELRPGPAMRSKKIKPGDRIVAVGQGDDEEVVDVVDWKLSKIVQLIRGPKGTKVRLTLIPVDAADPSERREVSLVRDEIKLEDEEAKARIIDLPDTEGKTRRIGLIDLPSFYATLDIGTGDGKSPAKSTMIDVAKLLSKLKREQVEGIILDLRKNGGGSLEEAIDLTGLFIKEGPVVQVRDYRDRVFENRDSSPDVFYAGPLAVLTSRYSASASEILAGCLQDYGRALIVGDASTHGKGTVQSLIQLRQMLAHALTDEESDPGAVKITIRKFYRASGASTQLRGIVPDLILPSVNNHADIGEASLDDPLPWDTISAAKFVSEGRIAPILGDLRRKSESRVAADQEFQYIREDIGLYEEREADKTVSLNLEQRLREKKENEARLEDRKTERKSRPEPDETIYEITLKNFEMAGLPEPLDPNAPPDETGAPHTIRLTDPETEEEDTGPIFDAALDEAKQILLDLIDLSGRARSALAQSN